MATTATVEAADVTYERLLNPEPQNWLTHHRDYSAQRHSPLEVITKSNIKTLKLVFAVPLGGRSAGESIEATPLVAPAIAGAISQLTGVRLRHTPFTPERVKKALA